MFPNVYRVIEIVNFDSEAYEIVVVFVQMTAQFYGPIWMKFSSSRYILGPFENLFIIAPDSGQTSSVAEWLECWTCDHQVAGSNPGCHSVACIHGQVVHAHVSLSSSSIISTSQ